ncbi:FCD domain-containing protein [Cryobacterium sp. SO2]|uniref:FadR/GntR family transcriptional regulator n=1 Tax=Cryobacterium sp. SO2 TaxID=1897060 RepID=UPI00223DF065|nr:FCD domain-containing protein [Cryobacterium sp. SO2]WEO77400.1 FCD domain-containing protein [Cryobacterium sp. SO2]
MKPTDDDRTAATDPDQAPAAALLNPAVAGITRLSATDTVRARIALAVQLQLLAPGEQLPSDAEVAAALKVSEITARRALKSLADEGLLSRRRGRAGGTFVADTPAAVSVDAIAAYFSDAHEVHGLIDRRVLIEASLAHHAALTADAGQLDELDAWVAKAASAQSWTEYHAADESFHLAVARASGQDWALPHYCDVLYALYRYFLPYPVAYLHTVNEEHTRLVAALRNRDPVAAVRIIEEHVSVLHTTMFVGLAGAEQVRGAVQATE